MIVAMVFAHVWGVLQLLALGSLSRTIGVRTVLAGVAVGLYACAPVALLLQLAWIHLAAALTGMSARYELTYIAAYTVDPFIEEVVKVLPVALLLWLVPVVRRQWSITDCVLLGAAAGSGFGLAECLYRYGDLLPMAIPTGWKIALGTTEPHVPSVWMTLHSWLPQGATGWEVFEESYDGYPWVNLHLAWSAIAGLGVGVIALRKGRVARIAGVGLVLYVALDHAAWNARLQGSWVSDLIVAPFAAVRDGLPFLPLAVLAIAWWLDRVRQSGRDPAEPTLAAEQIASPRWVGSLRAAVRSLPWSLPSVYGLSRMRRAYSVAWGRGSRDELGGLRSLLVSTRDRIDRQLLQPQPPSRLSHAWKPGAWLTVLRQPAVMLWLVLIAPAFLWGVVGGYPQTAWLQETVTGALAWNVVRVLSLAAQVWLAWRVFVAARSWLTTVRLPLGDDAAILGLRIACGVGALGLGGYALLRSFSVDSPQYPLRGLSHVAQAFESLGGASALMYTGATAALVDLALGAANSIVAPLAGVPAGVLLGKQGDALIEQGGRDLAKALWPDPGPKADTAKANAAEAKARWEAAEAGVKEAERYYARVTANAESRAADVGSAYGAYEKARADVSAAKAGGDEAALIDAMQKAGAADADRRKAMALAEVAETGRQGALAGFNSAESNAEAARLAYQAAAKESAQAQAEAIAAEARGGKPRNP